MKVGKLLKCLFVGALSIGSGASAYNICTRTPSECEGNWGLGRSDMPQIVDRVREQYLNQSSHFDRWVEPKRLVPIQNEINSDIVDGIVESYNENKFNPCSFPILAAIKNMTYFYILDGHHTTKACEKIAGMQLTTIIYGAAEQVFNRILKFPGVFRIGFNGQRIE